MQGIIQNIQTSLYQGFIDASVIGSEQYKPELLVNDPTNHQYVLTTVIDEITHCKTFLFSVAFITESGLSLLKSYLFDLKQKNISGKILTSNYLFFNQPKVFKELLKLSNVEVRISDLPGFHAKGYLFNHGEHHSLVFGSSNLTANALKQNYEWNVKISSHANGEIIHKVYENIDKVWHNSHPLTLEWVNKYEEVYSLIQESKQRLKSEIKQPIVINEQEVTPNKMQLAALQSIKEIRQTQQQKRALIISATGTGKTYLAAFDIKNDSPERVLFVAHQEQIIKKALVDFKHIIGGCDEQYGILSGNFKQTQAKYLFATIQTLSKPDIMHSFKVDAFDYILIDEVHKVGAKSYLTIIDYFQPRFLLGMTATPERTDTFNIFELFDYNIAYEIRLQEALAEDMLCPFHYFGVTDFEYDGKSIDDTTKLSTLISNERVQHIIEKIEYYGYYGEKVKGLIFCSRKEEAKDLSSQLNEKGYKTVALTGEDTISHREKQIKRLENSDLEYILTVDIFNEGIDIPCINQIVMLRQTQSSIIFIQQLGRGLRKAIDKEFVTVIDFIGNYKNNYLIPIALSGDTSQNKDNLRRKILDPNYIQGISTINFEQIAKERIFKAISLTKLNTAKILKEAYELVKNRVGRIPKLADFIKQHSIDPSIIALTNDNYYCFLLRMKEAIPALSKSQQQILTMVSNEILNGKRIHELELLKVLLEKDSISVDHFVHLLKSNHCYTDKPTLDSVERILNLDFFTKQEQDKYGHQGLVVKDKNDIFRCSYHLYNALNTNQLNNEQQSAFFRLQLNDLITTGLMKSENFDKAEPLKLYEKYTRKDVCRLLNWQKNEQGNIFGYAIKSNDCPIFITYHKTDNIDGSINYQDKLINTELLLWYTRSNRTLQSNEVKKIIQAKKNGLNIHIFIKKDDDEGLDFYYMGKAIPEKGSEIEEKMKNNVGKELPVVRMFLKLNQQIDKTLYQYLTNN